MTVFHRVKHPPESRPRGARSKVSGPNPPTRTAKSSSGPETGRDLENLGLPKAVVDLRHYQLDAFAAAMRYLGRPHGGGFCLFMEQRTGKSPTSCAIVERVQPKHLVIACPDIALNVWHEHLERYGLTANRQVEVMNFQSLWRQRRRLYRQRPDFVIVDESHRIKGRQAKQSKMLRKLGRNATWKLALTGTPLEGKIWDAWAQFDFIDPSVFGDWAGFAERYLVYGGFKGKKIVGIQNEDDFQLKFKSRFFRVLLEEVKTKKTKIAPANIIEFDLVESRAAYDSMDRDFIVDLGGYVNVRMGSRFVRRKKRIVAPRVITQIMKLHQLSGGFIIDDKKQLHRIGDEKLTQTGALLMRLGNVPTVIFVRFVPELYRIAALVRAMGRTVTLVSGKNKFSTFDTDVIVVQIRSGVSIDLSRAEEAIFHSWGYSFLDYDQAKFRIRSFTSTRARYHYIVGRNTIDELLYDVVTEKTGVVAVYLNHVREKITSKMERITAK